MYISNDKSTLNRRYWKNPITSILTSIRSITTPIYKALTRVPWGETFSCLGCLLVVFGIIFGIICGIVYVVRDCKAQPEYELVEINKINDAYFVVVRNTNPFTKEYWPDRDIEEITLIAVPNNYGSYNAECLSTEYSSRAVSAAEDFAKAQNKSERLTEYLVEIKK